MDQPSVEQPETLEELERAERRRRVMAVGAVVVVLVALALYLFLPRTLTSGELGGQTWRLDVAPVAFSSEVRLVGTDPADADRTRVARSGGLDETVVWRIGDAAGDPAETATIVVGPTPDGVASVRVTADEIGVGEARIQRVGWRRYHVDKLPGHVDVVELVAIDADGRPIQVSELGRPEGPSE